MCICVRVSREAFFVHSHGGVPAALHRGASMEVEPSVCFGFLVLLVNTASVARSAIYTYIQLDKWDGRLGVELGEHKGSTIVLVIAESKFSAQSQSQWYIDAAC